jgi:hypothetical protein
MSVVDFLASPKGRVARITVGVGLIAAGAAIGGGGGIALIVVGVLPLASGSLNFCLLRGLMGSQKR